MSQPFRIGVMQLTMEPLEEILEHARAMDEGGFDTIWLAEAYPWWRKHSMEARSSTALSPVIARETEKLAIGWGIISPFTRHPIQIAMEARVTQEAAGEGRFYLGLGVSKIFMRHANVESKPVAAMKEAAEIVRGILAGEALDFDGKVFSAHVPALMDDADAPRWDVPIYFAGTGPMMLRASAQAADGLLTASITTPAFVRYVRGQLRRQGATPIRSTSAARSSPRSTRTASAAATARARSQACTWRTRCRTSRPRRTLCSSAPG